MIYNEILEKGYFAKELPPPFQTKIFANKLTEIKVAWEIIENTKKKALKLEKDAFKEKFRESKWVIYSIPKVGFSRRLLGIPNPFHQSILAASIADNWTKIEKIFDKSTITTSKPIHDTGGNRALKSITSFGDFKRECLVNSFDKLFEVKTDISRYYGTIYTHIIPWIIHTKTVAKSKRTDASLLGNLLDKNLRDCNSGQTLGIPIGPDTSLVIAEIIGCTLDKMIQDKFKTSVKGFRYIDDYYIYCRNQADAEEVFKYIQSVFAEFQLDINEEKTKISKSPFPFETHWSIELGSFTFRKHPQSQQTDIERFISVAFKNAKNYPKDSVLNFAVSILKNIQLFDESWKLYQSVILKIGLTEPVTLPVVAQILVSHRRKVEKIKVKSVIENIIKEHTRKGHHFEVAWALWICKEFKIKLRDEFAELVFNSNDVISILIALDLKKSGFINSNVSTLALESDLTTESLMTEKWLLTYEAIRHDWVPDAKINTLKNNEYFDILRSCNVRFYDEHQKIAPFKLASPDIRKPRKAGETRKPRKKSTAISVRSIGY